MINLNLCLRNKPHGAHRGQTCARGDVWTVPRSRGPGTVPQGRRPRGAPAVAGPAWLHTSAQSPCETKGTSELRGPHSLPPVTVGKLRPPEKQGLAQGRAAGEGQLEEQRKPSIANGGSSRGAKRLQVRTANPHRGPTVPLQTALRVA